MDGSDIAAIKVFPGVGIARLGNSPTEFYVGPEAPGETPNRGRPFKDALGRVRRQAARFRIYAFGKSGQVLGELTSDNATITWRVHLANKKASWFKFQSRFTPTTKRALRNIWAQSGPIFQANPDLRTELIIDPGVRTISGPNKAPVQFDTGKFHGIDVNLGELRTDEAGRLLVLGGFGQSGYLESGKPISTYANNDYWYDDTSDGPVEATVVLSDGKQFLASPSRVIVAPPKFAASHENIVTLYEIVAAASGALPDRLPSDVPVEFYRDVFPTLRRVASYGWLNKFAHLGHGPGMGGDFLNDDLIKVLSDPADTSNKRTAIFNRIRVPAAVDAAKNITQAHANFMPPISGDDGDATEGAPKTWLTVTPLQYDILKHWADGKFTTGAPIAAKPFDRIPIEDQPAALNEASLRPCVGGAFFPGIEITYIAEDKTLWSEPFRMTPDLPPGAITRWMAVPWQADFFECNTHWWPAARPDDVLPEDAFADAIASAPVNPDEDDEKSEGYSAALAERVAWARGIPDTSPDGDNAMVKFWSELGFVVPKQLPDGEIAFVETERSPLVGFDARELYFELMNVDDYPQCLAKARDYVDYWLKWAEDFSNDATNSPHSVRFFPFAEDALQNRLDEIYQELVDEVRTSDPTDNPTFKTREDMVTRTVQLAPFNLIDGAWLHTIGRTGPIDEVRSLLYSIAMDEMGDGDVSHNHCNIYLDLLHSMGCYPHVIDSKEFAFDPQFLDSAFTIPTFELAIAQFPNRYYPEIIGMTLQLEWTVLDLKPTRDLLMRFGFDPHFYVMHIGIDNAVNGHGQRAAEAARLYLQQIRTIGGEPAVQEAWRRIWNGFVAFGNAGGNAFTRDLDDLLHGIHALRDQMIEMISRKAPYARYNHDTHMVGPNRINAWFEDPPGFLDALLKYNYITPGDWENSRIAQLISFDTGPMYRVFTDAEIDLWRKYVTSLKFPPSSGRDEEPTDTSRAMAAVIDQLRPQQQGVAGHQFNSLADANGQEHPVAWWFTQPTRDFMAALANPSNNVIVAGTADSSRFVTDLISPAGPMGSAFAAPAQYPGAGSCFDVAAAWINANCPLPPQASRITTLRLNSSRQKRNAHPTGRIYGLGTVH